MNEQTPELCACEIKVTSLTTSFFGAQMFWQITYCPRHAAVDDLLKALEFLLPVVPDNRLTREAKERARDATRKAKGEGE